MADKKIVVLRRGIYVVNKEGKTVEAVAGAETSLEAAQADKLLKKGFAILAADHAKKFNISGDSSKEVAALKKEVAELKKESESICADAKALRAEYDAYKAANPEQKEPETKK